MLFKHGRVESAVPAQHTQRALASNAIGDSDHGDIRDFVQLLELLALARATIEFRRRSARSAGRRARL